MQALIAMSSATHFYRHTNASSQMLRSQTAEYVSKSTCTHSQMQTHAELTYHKKKIMKGLKRRWMDDKKGWGQGQRYKNRKGKMIIYKRNLISTLHKSLYLDLLQSKYLQGVYKWTTLQLEHISQNISVDFSHRKPAIAHKYKRKRGERGERDNPNLKKGRKMLNKVKKRFWRHQETMAKLHQSWKYCYRNNHLTITPLKTSDRPVETGKESNNNEGNGQLLTADIQQCVMGLLYSKVYSLENCRSLIKSI